jgi:osmotically-inducible protein OsmY
VGSPSDRALRDEVSSALAAAPGLEGARISVKVHDGVVMLTGSARDRAQVDRAREVTERIVGVARVSASISASS